MATATTRKAGAASSPAAAAAAAAPTRDPDEMQAVTQAMPAPNARAGWDSRLNVRYDARARGNFINVVYKGRRVAPVFEGMEEEVNVIREEHIDVIVPDARNAAAVGRYLAPIIPPGASRAQIDAALAEIRPADIHLNGPQYHFVQGEASAVVEDDWPFLRDHVSYVFERA